uniref:Uncharacterized protein n=1 Tax=Hyaloperonospora arabidopsidis (strain Emoy2) TaxID=559515 RepID=M4BQ88_HYAAE
MQSTINKVQCKQIRSSVQSIQTLRSRPPATSCTTYNENEPSSLSSPLHKTANPLRVKKMRRSPGSGCYIIPTVDRSQGGHQTDRGSPLQASIRP